MPAPIIILFPLHGLRLQDHPALGAATACALAENRPLLPLFIWDEARPRPLGAASRWWLARALEGLAADLKQAGHTLVLRKGSAAETLTAVCRETGADQIFFTRGYDRAARSFEAEMEKLEQVRRGHVRIRRFGGALLFEPEDIRTAEGRPYTVYSPFWRKLLTLPAPSAPDPVPSGLEKVASFDTDTTGSATGSGPASASISGAGPASGTEQKTEVSRLGVMPCPHHWTRKLEACWKVGEAAAHSRLADFMETQAQAYAGERDNPGVEGTSRLSPYLRFGQISPRTIWHEVGGSCEGEGREKFLKELVWREFSYHLLFHFPHMETKPLRENFEYFPWIEAPLGERDQQDLERWQQGRTGFPIVDAGMRQLWNRGWMHNRVRMITASFLVKDMLFSWKLGESWFWDTLVDADPASNVASWQWVAGCGADAAPYFRIFNPTLQSQKFDPKGDYIRAHVPELADRPAGDIHSPAKPGARSNTGPDTGGDTGPDTDGGTGPYPAPMLDRAEARSRALQAFETVKTRR